MEHARKLQTTIPNRIIKHHCPLLNKALRIKWRLLPNYLASSFLCNQRVSNDEFQRMLFDCIQFVAKHNLAQDDRHQSYDLFAGKLVVEFNTHLE